MPPQRLLVLIQAADWILLRRTKISAIDDNAMTTTTTRGPVHYELLCTVLELFVCLASLLNHTASTPEQLTIQIFYTGVYMLSSIEY